MKLELGRALLALGICAVSAITSLAAADDPPPPQPALAAPGALPELDADLYFEGKTPGTFGKDIGKVLPASKRVAVAGFRVVFITQSTATASVRASYLPGGVERSAAHASISVKLEGVDNATLQALTDKAYAGFIQQLQAAGREVVPQEQIQPVYARLELAKSSPEAPYTKESMGRTGVVYTPAGMPLWWFSGDAWGDLGPFNQKNMRTIPDLSKELDAIVIAPTIVVDFATMESSGNRSGLMAREAEVGATLAMSVQQIYSPVTRATETKGGLLSAGDEGFIRMTRGVAVEAPFADMEQVQEKKTSGWLAVMTGSSKNKTMKAAKTDNSRYSAPAEQVLNQATGALARFFQQHST